MNFNLISKVINSIRQNLDRWRGPEAPRVNSSHVKRNERQWKQITWKAYRAGSNLPRGGPVMTGKRLTRTQSNCNPKNLTVLCRGARITWTNYLLGKESYISNHDCSRAIVANFEEIPPEKL